jgi:hypothetical protein
MVMTDREHLLAGIQYLQWSWANTLRMLEQYSARVEEYDNELSNPTLKGKERKIVRQRRFRAKKSLEQTQRDLDGICTAYHESVTQLEALSITSYLSPILRYSPSPFFTVDGIYCPFPTPLTSYTQPLPFDLDLTHISTPVKSRAEESSLGLTFGKDQTMSPGTTSTTS